MSEADSAPTGPFPGGAQEITRAVREWFASPAGLAFCAILARLAESMPPPATPPLTLRRPRRLRAVVQPQETPDA